ncbi:ABC transporter permease [Anaerotignum lactatifermentans]|uniref:ABC transporter permease n=1 Tax=Anaerotignum lactatifermentans TaxID=160404 RepID=A0ABS2G5Q0_9FIRM|nr:ABC transporter permease [Anaerotignum lactatifermentans]MBM6828093.1 ABC transporter permease [Anaerotignum lactatifermentans]MBM6876744.1 ABC transporter permease [Anaerotignum lactatifermentans]MBM6949676.1 ABC transporter permease [Anaerotignum lactatifermentans]
MNAIFELCISTLTQGFIYALLSYGVYITYKILDFPDLTVDGSFPLGAAVGALLLVKGTNPFLTLLAALAVGAVAGFVTGFIHVKLGVRDLLAGIITMTGLFSINLQIAGSNLAVERSIDTIFTSGPIMAVMGNASLIYRKFVVTLILAIVVKLVLDWYLKTKNGLLLRAVGDNPTLVTTLAKDKGTVKLIGLVIANALVSLCGAVVCQEQRSFFSTMGTGQVVFGLAAVIIGTTLFRKMSVVKATTAVMIGSIFYKACIQVAISLGLPSNLMKLATAVLFLLILVLGNKRKGGAEHA